MIDEEVIALSKSLIRCPSITPKNAGALEVLGAFLESIGFKCHSLVFEESGTPSVKNLYARFGTSSPNICFAGHTDVVPVGSLKDWNSDPFSPEIRDGNLYGRGTADMKCALAAFAVAVKTFNSTNLTPLKGSISFLITGDEEGPAINGTTKVLDWLKAQGETLDHCLVGEPTSSKNLGDIVKIGRRGSLNALITFFGVQGHAAYPQLAKNPITPLISLLSKLSNKLWDDGNSFFQPSNLEITSIDVGNSATNMIPNEASACFNLRFNDLHTGTSLKEIIENEVKSMNIDYKLEVRVSGEAFFSSPGFLSQKISSAVKSITKIDPILSTDGGTSDARFIKDFCPVAEFGMVNDTAHKIDEHVPVKDIFLLTDIYTQFLRNYFN